MEQHYHIHPDQWTRGDKIGRGQFGIVYLAKLTIRSTQQTAAVKIVDETDIRARADWPEVVKESTKEASILAKLDHPNIVKFYGISIQEKPKKEYAIFMEYIDGGDLFRLLSSQQPLSWKQRLKIVQDIAAGLDYLHKHNVQHKDLKSHNILLTLPPVTAKLTDFGESKQKAQTAATTITDKLLAGTLEWIAPESLKGEKYTIKSDMYSYGMVVWEIMSRTLPYLNYTNQLQTKLGREIRGIELRNSIIEYVKKGGRETMPNDPLCPKIMIQITTQCWQDNPKNRPTAQQAFTWLEREKFYRSIDWGTFDWTQQKPPEQMELLQRLCDIEFQSNINLSKCLMLTNKWLALILQRHGASLTKLDISYCPKLTTIAIHIINQYCPGLKVLNLDGLQIKHLEFYKTSSSVARFFNSSKHKALHFKDLTILSLRKCHSLQTICLAAPKLNQLDLKECANIRYFYVLTATTAKTNLDDCRLLSKREIIFKCYLTIEKYSAEILEKQLSDDFCNALYPFITGETNNIILTQIYLNDFEKDILSKIESCEKQRIASINLAPVTDCIEPMVNSDYLKTSKERLTRSYISGNPLILYCILTKNINTTNQNSCFKIKPKYRQDAIKFYLRQKDSKLQYGNHFIIAIPENRLNRFDDFLKNELRHMFLLAVSLGWQLNVRLKYNYKGKYEYKIKDFMIAATSLYQQLYREQPQQKEALELDEDYSTITVSSDSDEESNSGSTLT